MTEVQIYLFAPKRRGRKWVRAIKIEEAHFKPDGRSYTPGRTLVSAEVPCDQDAPDECLIIRGRVEMVV